MFRLTMNPASEGDCLVLAWGNEADPHHALIDLGRQGDFKRLKPWLETRPRIDLFTISHIDADHIAGAMPMHGAPAPFAPADVWFNGFGHLTAAKKRAKGLVPLGAKQGNALEEIIEDNEWPWNIAFDRGPVSVDSPQAVGPIALPGGLSLTLLSPADTDLADLHPIWEDWLRDEGLLNPTQPSEELGLEVMGATVLDARDIDVVALADKRFVEDDEAPNGSSIAFLAEYGGKRVLLGADAHPSRVAATLAARGYGPDRKLKLDLFKLCHHGSAGNISRELLGMIDCTRFAISTNGTHHSHPNPEAIARILVVDSGREKVFYFNSAHAQARVWEDATLQSDWNYRCSYPKPRNRPGIAIDI